MGEPGRGRRAPRAVPASPLFLDVEFAKMRDAAPSPPASTEGVAALNAALLQAQISSPIVSASAWDDGAEPDRAGARLTELVEALHKCPPTDYTEMVRCPRSPSSASPPTYTMCSLSTAAPRASTKGLGATVGSLW